MKIAVYTSIFGGYDDLMDDNSDKPLLVFHYGMTLKSVEDKLYERNIILRGEKFTNTSAIAK